MAKMTNADKGLIYGLTDILTFNCGRRPHIRTEKALWGMIFDRFDHPEIYC